MGNPVPADGGGVELGDGFDEHGSSSEISAYVHGIGCIQNTGQTYRNRTRGTIINVIHIGNFWVFLVHSESLLKTG